MKKIEILVKIFSAIHLFPENIKTVTRLETSAKRKLSFDEQSGKNRGNMTSLLSPANKIYSQQLL
jgi:hypothetical protein